MGGDVMERLMPDRLDLGNHGATTVGQSIHQRKCWIADGSPMLSARMVMGYRLPSWQRPFVWKTAQKIKLIESIWLGLSIGTYTFNRDYEVDSLDNLIIDGQQRLKAIEGYIEDEFSVDGYHWSELPRREQRAFESRHFHCYITSTRDEGYLRSYYDMVNFGGTAHKESERATPPEDK